MTQEYEPKFDTRLKSWHGEEWHTKRGRLIRDVVYAVDTGLIVTVGFLSGVSASLADLPRILVAGFIYILAGTVAIFFGSYISTKAQVEFFGSQLERERREIREMPEKERQEIREIFADMGFEGAELKLAEERITQNEQRGLKFMAQEEIGIIPGTFDNPIIIGALSAGAFLVGALPAFIPYLIGLTVHAALATSAITVLVFLFLLGWWKTRYTRVHWLKSGLETLLAGAVSSGAGFGLGRPVLVLVR